MTSRIDLFDSTYSNFSQEVLQTIRGQTFGRDIGQNSGLTADEYDRFISWLQLLPAITRSKSRVVPVVRRVILLRSQLATSPASMRTSTA